MTAELAAPPNHATATALYEQMARIRRFEVAAYRGYEQGEIHGTVHVSIGQEAVAVGVVGGLRPTDQVLSHHRGHGHALAKGVPPDRLMAELFGRVDGVSRGKGGSMHSTHVERGFLGTMAIVGSAIPLAAGVALANTVRGTDDVCVAFFGDGAINQGVLYETINLAALWGLPLLLVCENNSYAITTSAAASTAGPGVVARAQSFGVVAESVDGQDVLAMRSVTERLLATVRSGEPALIEAMTYRFMGHSRGDPSHGVYRTKDEVNSWKERDPMVLLAQAASLSDDIVRELDEGARGTAEAAMEFARASRRPEPADLVSGVLG